MTYELRPATPADVAAIVSWRYPGRYSTYDVLGDESFEECHAVLDGGELVGYSTFGTEARMEAMDAEPGTVDVGWGLRPDLMGRGCGGGFIEAILALGRDLYTPERFRIAVLDWNERSRRAAESAGFRPTGAALHSPTEGGRFVVLERVAGQG